MVPESLRGTLLSSVSALALSSAWLWPIVAGAQSLPTNANVVSGSVGVAQSANRLTVTQSTPTGIINWSTFSIGQGNQVSFQNGSGSTLNRVTGNVPSSLNGLLTATGSVYLINPAGIAVGPTGVIKTGGSFVGSTLDIADDKFRAGGSLTFSGNSTASVVNLGKIGSSRGDVVLIAQQVENAGSIRARKGTVGLASGTEVTIRDQEMADGKIAVSLPAANGSVRNTGSIRGANAELRANGGNVYALGVNTRSVIKATGVASKGGRIFLTATGGNVTVSSRVSAQRKQTVSRNAPKDGGLIVVTGTNVTLTAGAKLDASGETGGTILVGGDRAGGSNAAQNFANFQIVNAQNTTVEAGATITANGTFGDGGNIVVWSDGTTNFAGTISARGGATFGNGGFAEVSGHILNYSGIADLRAPAGKTGLLLLDPYDLTIDASAASTISTNLGTANVTVQTSAGSASSPGVANPTGVGDITINSAINWASANTLTLDAYRGININANLTASGAGKVVIVTNNGGSGGDYAFGSGASLKFTGTAGSGQALTINGNSYNLIYTRAELAAIGTNTTTLAQRYALANNLDLSGSNFGPIGTLATPFTGVFEGVGNTIANLTQTNQASSSALFAATQVATLRDFNMTNVSLTHDGTGAIPTYVGAVVGYADNNAPGGTSGTTLKNISVSGNISINKAHSQNIIGGVIGVLEGFGTATNIRSSINVTQTGTDVAQTANVGGLVGSNSGTITQSYASGAVSGIGTVGGFAGLNDGTITQSYSTGNVTLNNPAATAGSADSLNGTIALFAGGFVGVNGARGTGVGTITQSYSTGAVNVNAGSNRPGQLIITPMAGGFTGTNTRRFTGDSINGGTINEVFATGYVGGNATQSGGIVGKNNSSFTGSINGTVTNAYWDTQTTGQTTITGDAGASTTGGMTTAALQGTLPANFNTVQSGVWSTAAGRYAYFGWRFASAPDVISGKAFSDSGTTALAGSGVEALVGGAVAGTAGTGANGYYYIATDAGSVSGGVLTSLTGTTKGNAFIDGASGVVAGFDIYGSTLRLTSGGATYSGIVGNLATALGSNTGANYLFTAGAGPTIALKSDANLEINSSASALTMDQSITASGTGTVTVVADDMTLSNAITTAGTTVKLMTTTAGRGITLGGSAAGTLGLSNAELNQITASTLQIGNDGNTSGAIAVTGAIAPASITNLKLLSGSSVSQTTGSTITATNLAVVGTAVTLGQANSVNTVAINASGAVNFVASGNLTVGSVAGINGVTAGGTATINAGGDLTLDATNGTVSAVGSGNALQLVSGGTFTNNKGSSALSIASGGGRWLVWSQTPVGDTRGGLTYDFKQYNATFGVSAAAQATGNGFLYTIAPSVTATLTGTVSKVYDRTTSAAGISAANFNVSGAIDGDTVNVSNTGGTYSQANVGTGLSVTATGLTATSATNGAATVYGYGASGSASGNIGEITTKALTITGTKTYDQSAAFTLAQLGLSGVISGDTATLTGGSASVSSANANTYNSFASNTLTVSNSNYAVTGAGVTVAATINKAPLTLTAAKTYDGLASFTSSQVTASGVLSGDTATLTGGSVSVSSKNAASYNAFTANTLTVSNSNYAATGAGVTASATVNKATLTLTAATNSKIYDGTDSAAATPTIGGLQVGDTVTGLTETYDNKNAGSSKILSVSGYTVNDGNSGNNYNVGTVTNTTGSIGKASLTLTAVADTKGYDGTTASSAAPTIGGLQTGDTVSGLSQIFDSKNVGSGKTMTLAGYTVNDGNSGNNYNVSTATNAAGVVTAQAVTATANAFMKTQGLADPIFTYQITTGALAAGDTFTGLLARDPGDAVGTYWIKQGTLALSANYVLTYVGANLTINAAVPDNVFGSFSTPLGPNNGPPAPIPASNTGNQPGGISVGDNTGGTGNTPLFCAAGDACSQMPFQNNLQYGQWIHFAGSQ